MGTALSCKKKAVMQVRSWPYLGMQAHVIILVRAHIGVKCTLHFNCCTTHSKSDITGANMAKVPANGRVGHGYVQC